MPGEFEPQEAVLVAWPITARPGPPIGEDRSERVLCEIVRAIHDDVRVLVPAAKPSNQRQVLEALAKTNLPAEAVEFIPTPSNYQWIRDYGPVSLRSFSGSRVLIEADYLGPGLVNLHPQEDRFPGNLGIYLDTQVVRAPIALEHGNLLSNGQGLCITTEKLLRSNHGHGLHKQDVTSILRKFYGVQKLLVLEPMQGELTGHVDMFATFTAADTVVIGEYSPQVDPVNAAILDRNAASLASLPPPWGPLRVYRIPMPCRPQFPGAAPLWPTYTNVVYGNHKMLMAVYPELDPTAEAAARKLYELLLPDREIVGIDASPFLSAGGSLHCATMNLFALNAKADTASEPPSEPTSGNCTRPLSESGGP